MLAPNLVTGVVALTSVADVVTTPSTEMDELLAVAMSVKTRNPVAATADIMIACCALTMPMFPELYRDWNDPVSPAQTVREFAEPFCDATALKVNVLDEAIPDNVYPPPTLKLAPGCPLVVSTTPALTMRACAAPVTCTAVLELPLWSYQDAMKPLFAPVNAKSATVSKVPAEVKPMSSSALSLFRLTRIDGPVYAPLVLRSEYAATAETVNRSSTPV